MAPDGSVVVSVPVANTGSRAAAEVVQLYVRDLVASMSRPVKELKHFERVELQPGETKTVSFTITPADLSFYNSNLEFVLEPGEFDIMVGPSSAEVQTARLTVR